jgi:hypothetical protein
MSKIIKNVRDIDRKDYGSLNRCVKRQNFKNPHGFKPIPMFRDIFFILLNLTLSNLISLGVSHFYMLNYGFYQV